MVWFTIGAILLVAGGAAFLFGKVVTKSLALRGIAAGIFGLLGCLALVLSTTLYVEDDEGGLVVRKLGKALPPGSIIATKGEAGPQAAVLSPGWHFGYWPWLYDLTPVENIDIPRGKVGVVTAKDGKALPAGQVYADAWSSATDMLDAEKFLESGNGFRGPQQTVLPPGQYRFNPRQFSIQLANSLNVPVGTVAVIKDNAGPEYTPAEGKTVEVVNGVPIVPRSFRGIWDVALTPNEYYLHPNAYEVTPVKTTERIYGYIGKDSINVRTMDSYEFPVDVRVSVNISAENAPRSVALFGNPDADADKDGFDTLEERAILPSIRSIFRNSAEASKGLVYVSSRSTVESTSTTEFTADMEKYHIEVNAVYVADIRLGDTEAGQALLLTQTDKELAVQQDKMYDEQITAQKKRADVVAATEEADRRKDIEAATAADLAAAFTADALEKQADGLSRAAIKKADGEAAAIERVAKADAAAIELRANAEAKARQLMAQADGEYNAKMVESLGGVENYTTIKLMGEAFTAWKDGGNVPHISVSGGNGAGGGSLDVVMAQLIQRFAAQAQPTSSK